MAGGPVIWPPPRGEERTVTMDEVGGDFWVWLVVLMCFQATGLG